MATRNEWKCELFYYTHVSLQKLFFLIISYGNMFFRKRGMPLKTVNTNFFKLMKNKAKPCFRRTTQQSWFKSWWFVLDAISCLTGEGRQKVNMEMKLQQRHLPGGKQKENQYIYIYMYSTRTDTHISTHTIIQMVKNCLLFDAAAARLIYHSCQ